ncbi:hypothetical protein Salat_2949400 [Sesamum alatum]|uniref:Uncharacterized protein n=1 Tax=Sesamum alatum TaxID=300844 RepID=A0AAE1XKB8_9LAMI|nr:hypothetical protein Salat_2949400 [Sesamum alatum]
MAVPSSLKPLHLFSFKSSSSSLTTTISNSNNIKLKTLIQTFIFSHMYRIARLLTRAKSVLIHLLKDIHTLIIHLLLRKNSKQNNKKLFFGSFRLHYNWCSSSHQSNSHVSDVIINPRSNSFDVVVYDGMKDCCSSSSELSKYLQWLEEKGGDEEEWSKEIDRLADLFIADCHEKFRLEKQESYRMFQEMMARSV